MPFSANQQAREEMFAGEEHPMREYAGTSAFYDPDARREEENRQEILRANQQRVELASRAAATQAAYAHFTLREWQLLAAAVKNLSIGNREKFNLLAKFPSAVL